MEEVKITINEDGTLTVEALGFEGADCLSVLNKLDLGETVSEEHTADWYKRPDKPTNQLRHVRGGR